MILFVTHSIVISPKILIYVKIIKSLYHLLININRSTVYNLFNKYYENRLKINFEFVRA